MSKKLNIEKPVMLRDFFCDLINFKPLRIALVILLFLGIVFVFLTLVGCTKQEETGPQENLNPRDEEIPESLIPTIPYEEYPAENLTAVEIYSKIKDIAISLKKENDFETAYAIDRFVRKNINYNYSYYARDLVVIWKTKQGDCTDFATLSMFMLRQVGIRSKRIEGYHNCERHDWYEFNYEDKWFTFEDQYMDELSLKSCEAKKNE
jgi:hypothetical protein